MPDKSEVEEQFASVSERNSEPRHAGRKCNSPRWSCVSSVTLGSVKKDALFKFLVDYKRLDKSEFEAPIGAISREPDRANVHVSDSERSRAGAQAPSVRVSVSERSREPQAPATA